MLWSATTIQHGLYCTFAHQYQRASFGENESECLQLYTCWRPVNISILSAICSLGLGVQANFSRKKLQTVETSSEKSWNAVVFAHLHIHVNHRHTGGTAQNVIYVLHVVEMLPAKELDVPLVVWDWGPLVDQRNGQVFGQVRGITGDKGSARRSTLYFKN